jgi:hypothetical protein
MLTRRHTASRRRIIKSRNDHRRRPIRRLIWWRARSWSGCSRRTGHRARTTLWIGKRTGEIKCAAVQKRTSDRPRSHSIEHCDRKRAGLVCASEPTGSAGDILRPRARDAVQRLRHALGKNSPRPVDFHFGVRAVVTPNASAAMGQIPDIEQRIRQTEAKRRGIDILGFVGLSPSLREPGTCLWFAHVSH